MSQLLDKGANTALPTETLTIVAVHSGPDTDLSAILVTSEKKVRSDHDFIFYGQPTAADGSVAYSDKSHENNHYSHKLTVDLNKLPADIDAIQITLTIDPDTVATFASVKDFTLEVLNSAGQVLAVLHPQGSNENAFIVAEIYRRNGSFKLRHVSQGFTGGLAAIARNFGINIGEPTADLVAAAKPIEPSAAKVNLTKVQKVTADLEATGSRLLSLQKTAAISLTKHKLDNMTVRVIFVLDASGSTANMWPEIMQAVTDRLTTLALNFDDNGELEMWIYATTHRKMASITVANLDGYIEDLTAGGDGSKSARSTAKRGFFGSVFGEIIPGLGFENNEPPIMQEIFADAKGSTTIPTMVVFVTDGGIDKAGAIETILNQSSRLPIFWQFVGLNGSSYGVLEKFDQLQGRYVDNAGFFAIDDYSQITDEQLYDRLLKEFPKWHTKVKALGMLNS